MIILKILKFLLFFLPWFISGLVVDTNFYNTLNLPFFALKPSMITIIWIILYFLIALSIYKNTYSNNYKKVLIINYIFNQLFTVCFFTLRSPFLGFVDTISVLVSSLLLYLETDNKKLLIPYLIYDLYAVILSLTIYFMNF